MPKSPKPEDPRLTQVTKICLALPDAAREVTGGHATTEGHATFTVRKKTFAYFLNNHHGDGRVCVTCKVLPGDNQRLAESEPEKFYMPAYIASRGWVASVSIAARSIGPRSPISSAAATSSLHPKLWRPRLLRKRKLNNSSASYLTRIAKIV